MEKMNNLSNLRKAHGIKQEELAALLGVSKQAYSNYERGEREAGYEILHALANHFNTSVDFLLDRTDVRLPPSKWTAEEKAAGVGANGTNLSNDEWEWLELRSALIESGGEELLNAFQKIITMYTEK